MFNSGILPLLFVIFVFAGNNGHWAVLADESAEVDAHIPLPLNGHGGEDQPQMGVRKKRSHAEERDAECKANDPNSELNEMIPCDEMPSCTNPRPEEKDLHNCVKPMSARFGCVCQEGFVHAKKTLWTEALATISKGGNIANLPKCVPLHECP